MISNLYILHELRKATTSIHIAVAWFTDPEIFEQLCQKLHKQVVRTRVKAKDLAVAISAIRTADAYRKVVAIEDWDEYLPGSNNSFRWSWIAWKQVRNE